MAGDEMVYWHWCLESSLANAMSIREVFSIIIKVWKTILSWDFFNYS